MSIININSREARTNWRDLLDKVLTGESDFVIERNGKPIAALIPILDFEALQDELDELRATRRAVAAYDEWLGDHSKAKTLAEVEKELTIRGLLDE